MYNKLVDAKIIQEKLFSMFTPKFPIVRQSFEQPNKYGEITGRLYFKWDIEDRFNYRKIEICLTYRTNSVELFIPCCGSFILEPNVDVIYSKILEQYDYRTRTGPVIY